MKVAVTYEMSDGSVFQHFGHTAAFKVYEIQDGKVISSDLVETTAGGHDALAGMLGDHSIDAVICGGIGGGAQAALQDRGIEVCSGVTGPADEAIEQYLLGNLISEGVNCDHHDHQQEEEGGCHCGGGCGSDDNGGCHCGGGCHGGAPQLLFDGKNAGKTVRVHYQGTFDDGSQFDSSYDRGQPLEFVCAAGMMIPGFDKAVAEMEVGQIVNVHLMPEEAYGMPDPNAIFEVELTQLPGAEDLNVGQQVYLQNAYGQPFPVVVKAKTDSTITFDANHEMAGKELNFKIELVEIL